LVAGYGIYQNKVEGEKISFWFQERGVNLAVVARPDGGVILDFDDIEVYFQFCNKWPKLAKSYTESTPRTGRHLFLRTTIPIPPGLVLVPGIEVKQLCLVSPSKVGGKSYRIIQYGDVLHVNVLEALQPFLAGGGDKELVSPKITLVGRPVGKSGYIMHNRGFVAELKARWPIVDYLRYFEPNLFLTGRGRWLSGRCPWHDDHIPSLWIDSKRNAWGCHACKAHGDILNWHALRLGENITNTIRDLARYKVEVTA
jgi:hypothetical protein